MWLLLFSCAVGQLFYDPTITEENTVISEPVEVDPNQEADIRDPQLCDDKVKQHAGFILFTGHSDKAKKFFFWLFEARNPRPKNDTPLVVWLTGGPGCSSLLALFAENGPCKVVERGEKTVTNPYSWNQKAHLLYVDQPAGTGWSEGHFVKGEDGVSDDMYAFLRKFYSVLPQYKNNPLYIAGESYAGHFIPAIAHKIFMSNQENKGEEMPLKGIAIGNGLTDAEEQYKWYEPMARDGGMSEGGTTKGGKISTFALGVMKAAILPCVEAIKQCNKKVSGACTLAYVVCNSGEMVPYQLSGLNPYDMREKCKIHPLCYDFEPIVKYLNRKDVQEKLGVSAEWKICNPVVNLQFREDWMLNFQQELPALLDSGIKVLIYAGDSDFICNWLGNKHWALKLEWNGKEGFNKAADEPFIVDNSARGRKRSFYSLEYVQVFQAGHMVARDQPNVAAKIINGFLGLFENTTLPNIIVA